MKVKILINTAFKVEIEENGKTKEIPLYLTERDKEGTVSTYRVVYDEDEKRFVKDLIDVAETKKKIVE